MKIQKKFAVMTALALVFIVMIFSGSAFAYGTDREGVDVTGPRILTENNYVIGASETGGDFLLFNYYDIRTQAQGGSGLTDNFFTVINTSGEDTVSAATTPLFQTIDGVATAGTGGNTYTSGKRGYIQAHVRVRTGQCSVELLDFDVLLSPYDVFTFDLTQGPTGNTVFASCDTDTLTRSQFGVDAQGCFILDTATFPNMTSLIQECGNCALTPGAASRTALSADAALEATRYGYVEVIGEIQLVYNTATAATTCTKAKLNAGDYNSYTWANSGNDYCAVVGSDLNAFADDSVPAVLFGKQYYARFESTGDLSQLSTINAFGYNGVCGMNRGATEFTGAADAYVAADPNCSQIIWHKPDLTSELSTPTGPGYAYNAVSSSIPITGAIDMNKCFYVVDTATTDYINQVGAAVTYGPTLADLRDVPGSIALYDSRCLTGDQATAGCDTTVTAVGTAPIDQYVTITESIVKALNDLWGKNTAVVQYFYLPGTGQTKSVFTLPLQHFLGQSVEIGRSKRYNTSEAECTISTGKFISPGGVLAGETVGEVSILSSHQAADPCTTYTEGWIAWSVAFSATPDLAHNEVTYITYVTGPATLGTVVELPEATATNINVFSTAPMQWAQ